MADQNVEETLHALEQTITERGFGCALEILRECLCALRRHGVDAVITLDVDGFDIATWNDMEFAGVKDVLDFLEGSVAASVSGWAASVITDLLGANRESENWSISAELHGGIVYLVTDLRPDVIGCSKHRGSRDDGKGCAVCEAILSMENDGPVGWSSDSCTSFDELIQVAREAGSEAVREAFDAEFAEREESAEYNLSAARA